jgi:hypothetical protein
MRNRNTKALSVLLVLAMLLTVLPISVSAVVTEDQTKPTIEEVKDKIYALHSNATTLGNAITYGLEAPFGNAVYVTTTAATTGYTPAKVRRLLGISELLWTGVSSLTTGEWTAILGMSNVSNAGTFDVLKSALANEISTVLKTKNTVTQVYTETYDTAGVPVFLVEPGKSYQYKVYLNHLTDVDTVVVPLIFDTRYVTITSALTGAGYPADYEPTFASYTDIFGYQATKVAGQGTNLDLVNTAVIGNRSLLLLTLTSTDTSGSPTLADFDGTAVQFVINFDAKPPTIFGAGIFGQTEFAVVDFYSTGADNNGNGIPDAAENHPFYDADAYDATYPYVVNLETDLLNPAVPKHITSYFIGLPIYNNLLDITIVDEALPANAVKNPLAYYENKNTTAYTDATEIDFGAIVKYVDDDATPSNVGVDWTISDYEGDSDATDGDLVNTVTSAGTIDANGVYTPAAYFAGDVTIRATSKLDTAVFEEKTVEIVRAAIPDLLNGSYSGTLPNGVTEVFTEADGTKEKVHTIDWNLKTHAGPLKLYGEVGGNEVTVTDTTPVAWEVYNLSGSTPTTDIAATVLTNASNETEKPYHARDDVTFTTTASGTYKIVVKSAKYNDVLDVLYITAHGELTIEGRAIRSGKQRTSIARLGYDVSTRVGPGFDEGIKVELIKNTTDPISTNKIEQVISTTYTDATAVVDTIPALVTNAYNFKLDINADVLDDIADASTTDTYFIRLSDVDAAKTSNNANQRAESYLYTNIDLKIVEGDLGYSDPTGKITITNPLYLYAGSFDTTGAHEVITAIDANLIKSQVGKSETEAGQRFNINEYLGVDAADYATVQNYIGKTFHSIGFINLGTKDGSGGTNNTLSGTSGNVTIDLTSY